jgi:hypothetical protein
LHALADRIVELHPDHPESHMLLSEAFNQMAKNIWRDHDVATIERSLRQSLDAALHGLSLDPEREDARRLVDNRRRRLDGLASGR